MEQILVATDLSTRSDRAVDRAFALAEQHGAKLTLTHIVDSELPEEMIDGLREKALGRLTARAAQSPSVEASVQVATADLQTAIHAAADGKHADLIVLGVHRPRPLADIFTSTTMERLVRGGQRPVLLVRDPVEGPYRRPLCGVDLSPACVAAAQMAARLVPDADLQSFFAFHTPFRGMVGASDEEAEAPFLREATAELEEWLAVADLPARFKRPTPVCASVWRALELSMREVKPDLLVVGAHGRSSLSPNLLGSFTTELLRQPLCDTLVVRG